MTFAPYPACHWRFIAATYPMTETISIGAIQSNQPGLRNRLDMTMILAGFPRMLILNIPLFIYNYQPFLILSAIMPTRRWHASILAQATCGASLILSGCFIKR